MINTKATVKPNSRIFNVLIGKTIVGADDKQECHALKYELNRSKRKRKLVKGIFRRNHK